jgi:hypothetical protein
MPFRRPFLRSAIIVAAMSASWIADARASEFPTLTVPDGTGVNTGINAPNLTDDDYVKLRASGIAYARFDVFWNNVERIKGTYAWGRYDRVFAKMKEYGLKPLVILAYNNRHYDEANGGIRSDQAREGFANFAAAAVARYSRLIPGTIWEVWNEPNSNDFWKPERNADEYVALLKAAVAAMREADPNITIVNGGIYGPFWDVTQAYLERCFALGMLSVVDGLAVHLYGGGQNRHPERIVEEIATLRKRMAAHGARPGYPILNTEYGAGLNEYKSAQDAPARQRAQADTYVRMYLLGLLADVRMTVWYEWQWKDGDSPNAILEPDGIPRTTYTAIAAATHLLGGYAFDRRIEGFGKENYVLALKKDGLTKLAVWTSAGPRRIEIPVKSAGPWLPIADMVGEIGKIDVRDGKMTVGLTGSPLYIDLGAAAIGPITEPGPSAR